MAEQTKAVAVTVEVVGRKSSKAQRAAKIEIAPKPLTSEETSELKRLEGIIEDNLMNAFAIGDALTKIKTEKLYRSNYRTFDQYCLAKWGFGRAYGYRHIDAAKVYHGIKELLTNGDTQLPQSEAQARPLVKLKEPAKMLKAWNTALKKAGDGRVTEDLVADVVAKMTGAGNRRKGAAKPVVDVAPASNPKPGPVIDLPAILELLEEIRTTLDDNDHDGVLDCVREIETLITGKPPTKTDKGKNPRVEEIETLITGKPPRKTDKGKNPRVEEQHGQEDELGEEERGDDAEDDEEAGTEHDGEPGEVVVNRW